MVTREPVEVTVEIGGQEVVAGTLWIREQKTETATFRYSDSYLAARSATIWTPRCRNRLASSSPGQASRWRAGVAGGKRKGAFLDNRQPAQSSWNLTVWPIHLRSRRTPFHLAPG